MARRRRGREARARRSRHWRLLHRLLRRQCALAREPWHAWPAIERLERFLVQFCHRAPRFAVKRAESIDAASGPERAAWLHLPMTRADLGSLLGLTEETVSRSLRRLERNGRIELRGREFRFRTLERGTAAPGS